jgi:aryl-alcohol dehydrogenase-like predicted oxidoreductase
MLMNTLGKTGITVSPLCPGAMMFGTSASRTHPTPTHF